MSINRLPQLVSGASLLALCFLGMASASADKVHLAKDGQALTPIVISPDASEGVRGSAALLAEYLGQITGAEFQVQESERPHGITLGTIEHFPSADLKESLEIRNTYDGLEAFAIRGNDGVVRLIANTDTGVSHAAHRFLELLGCRWFFMTPTWHIIPETRDLSFDGSEDNRPDIWSRQIWFDRLAQRGEPGDTPANELFARWAAANRMDRSFDVRVPHAWHAIPDRIPELFEGHPEYFALVDGERTGPQFCVSNPGLQQAIIAYVRQTLDGQPELHMVSLDPADTAGWCTCDKCEALGHYSVQPFYLANVAAKALQETHPGKAIGVLAYSWYSVPPPFELEPNVHVQLTRGLNAGPYTGDELYDLWSKRGNSLGIYEYYSYWHMDRNMIPGTWITDIDQNAERIRDYVSRGVVDMSAQSSNNWGIHGLAYYIANRLMWDASSDPDALRKDFLEEAFGPASEPMGRYFERVSRASDPVPGMGLLRQAVDDLEEAAALAAGRPDVLARIDDLRKLVVYSYLGEKVAVPAASYVGIQMRDGEDWDAKKQAYLDWFTWAHRIRNSHMIAWLTFRSAVGNPISKQYGPEWFWRNTTKDPSQNPWRDDRPVTSEELDEWFTKIKADLGPAPEIPERDMDRTFAFVPKEGDTSAASQVFGLSGRATFLVASLDGDPLKFNITTKPTVVRSGEGVAGVTQVREVVIETPDARYSLATPDGQVLHEGRLPLGTSELDLQVPGPGVYHFTCERSGSGWEVQFPKDVPNGLLLGTGSTSLDIIDAPGDDSSDVSAWFFVPEGTREILLQAYQSGTVQIRRPDGSPALEAASDGRFLRAPVAEGEDGKNWSLELTGEMRRGTFRFLNIPTIFTLNPTYAFAEKH